MTAYDVTTGRGTYLINANSKAEARDIFRRRVSRDAILRVDPNYGTVPVDLFR